MTKKPRVFRVFLIFFSKNTEKYGGSEENIDEAKIMPDGRKTGKTLVAHTPPHWVFTYINNSHGITRVGLLNRCERLDALFVARRRTAMPLYSLRANSRRLVFFFIFIPTFSTNISISRREKCTSVASHDASLNYGHCHDSLDFVELEFRFSTKWRIFSWGIDRAYR